MNPFECNASRQQDILMDWKTLWPQSYDKHTVNPYTRTRVILMNGTEFENVWFSHQFSRNTGDNALRRQLALIHRSEQQQQKLLCHLKPVDETVLEHTIGYEQLAVDLTAHLAKRVQDQGLKNALDFALLEDFDHLYRYADLLNMHSGVKAEKLVGRYTEIMPGRPTIAHHRHPFDDIRHAMTNPQAPIMDVLAANIITAAEQQTMNYYMNVAATYPDDYGRKLYQEIGMIEEQHVSHYGSLLNPCLTWLENLLVHQYVECYLYWSCYETETDECIRKVWECLFEQEVVHLHIAAELLKKYEGKDWQQVIPDGRFPAPLQLESNIPYVRDVLKNTVHVTSKREDYVDVCKLPSNADFFIYQSIVNKNTCDVMSHRVIEDHIARFGQDYRFETAPNPIPELRDRKNDNTEVGRTCQRDRACE